MPSGNVGFIANGNISPARFVKIDVTKDNGVLMAGAGEAAVGVSGMGTRNPPYSTLDDGFHAIAGEPCTVHQLGETAPLTIGAAVVRGDRLKSDASGRGIPALATEAAYAVAAQSGGAAGVIIEVTVIRDSV